jgi:hypothetical protein
LIMIVFTSVVVAAAGVVVLLESVFLK